MPCSSDTKADLGRIILADPGEATNDVGCPRYRVAAFIVRSHGVATSQLVGMDLAHWRAERVEVQP